MHTAIGFAVVRHDAGEIADHIDQMFRDVDLIQLVNNRDDPVNARIGEVMIFSQALNQTAARRLNDSNAYQKVLARESYCLA